jgi:copper chaperone CopZ
MKTVLMSVAIMLGMVLALPTQADARENNQEVTQSLQQGDYTKTSFKVDGLCSMCEERIETAAKEVDGVKKASWDQKTLKMTLVYDKKKTDVMKVHRKIAAAGHDTDEVKATDKAYAALPMCCKYRSD